MRNGFLIMLIVTGLITACKPEIPERSTFMDADGYSGATPKEFQDTSEKDPTKSTPPTAPFQGVTPLLAGAILLCATLGAMRLYGAILREFVTSAVIAPSGVWRPDDRSGGRVGRPCHNKLPPGATRERRVPYF